MHHRLGGIYGKHPKGEEVQLAAGGKFKSLLKTVEKAFKKLHSTEKYKPEDLAKVKEYRDVIRETNAILSGTLEDNNISSAMRKSLEEDIFLFSGLKTHSELFEASRQLRTKDGKIKSFAQFENDVKGVKESHRRYLDAEYQFATGSVLMAERWENFDDSDRYNLEYRTAGDDRVRDSHDQLRGTVLPKDDPFWDSYFPPNGWRCRCTAVQVIARNNPASDAKKAAKNGKEATTKIGKNGKNKLELFRFNPGKAKVVFPPGHPYRKVQGAKKVAPIIFTIIHHDKEKTELQNTYNEVRKKQTGTIKTKRFGEVMINRTSFNKTQNINKGNHQNQMDALNEIENLKSNLNAYKGKIEVVPVKNEKKAGKKPNIAGYVEIPSINKEFMIGLEVDKSVSEDYKLYYIKKVAKL